jgi:hypothetical protein
MRRIFPLALLILFLVGTTVGVYLGLTSRRPLNVWDLQPLWRAGRWIAEGRGSPYSDELTDLLQRESYGRLVAEGEDPRAFVYPPYALLVLLPVIVLPLPWAQAAWFTVLLLGIVTGIVGAMWLGGWQLPTWQMLLTVLWGSLLYPIAWAFVLGQVSILILALLVAALLAVRSDREGWAGVFLALTTIKPQMSFLLAPALLLWALAKRRFRFVWSFGGAMMILVLGSFIMVPGWPAQVVHAGAGYFEVQPFPPPVALLGKWIGGGASQTVTGLLVTLLLGGLAWAWWQERRAAPLPRRATGLTLVVTALIAPRTSIVNQASLFIPLCLLFAEMARRGRRWRRMAFAIGILLLVGLWAVDLLCFPPLNSGEHWHAQQRILSPILPTLLLIGLGTWPWWTRKRARRR